jgi:hypothetical protein
MGDGKRVRPALLIAAAVIAVAAIYCLDRGIFIGSNSFVNQGFLVKRCRYLFITGVTEQPAHGAPPIGNLPKLGMQLADRPDQLYCRIFQE